MLLELKCVRLKRLQNVYLDKLCEGWLYVAFLSATPLMLGRQTVKIRRKYSYPDKVKLLYCPHRAQPSFSDYSHSGEQWVTVSVLGPSCWWSGELHCDLQQWRRQLCARTDNTHKQPDCQQPEARGVLLPPSFYTAEEWKKKQANCNIFLH